MIVSALSATTFLLVLTNFDSQFTQNITYYQVYVKQLRGKALPSQHPSTLKVSDIRDYHTVYRTQSSNPYVAAEFPKKLFNDFKRLVIGNNLRSDRNMTTLRGYKGTTKGFLNGKLREGSFYSVFQKACVNDTFCKFSGWVGPVETASKSSGDSVKPGVIVGIVLGVAAGILIIFGLIFYFMQNKPKSSMKKEVPHKKSVLRRLISTRFVADPRLPVLVDDFPDHVSRLKFEENKGFLKEFAAFDHKILHPYAACSNPQNCEKNRFANIPAYDHSRVKLSVINDIPTSDYIHANIVRPYSSDNGHIVTQAPLPSTIPDFWRMIWENDIPTIVMLNNIFEKGEQACTKYWPDMGAPVEYGDIEVQKTENTEFASYEVGVFELRKKGKAKVLTVKHFHFLAWPSCRETPLHTYTFLEFLQRLKSWTHPKGTMVVHCISGTGRTGVFLVVYSQLARMARRGDISIYSEVEDVCDDRYQLIRTQNEYMFIHDCILESITCKSNVDIPLHDVTASIADLAKVNDAGQNGYQQEFEKISRASAKQENRVEIGNNPGNRAKNRFETLVPYDDTRVKLSKSKDGYWSDYINASYVDSYRKGGLFIATQAPLETTIFDFWRMVWEQDVRSIAILLEKEMFPPNEMYWPEQGVVLETGNFQIKVLSVESLQSFDLRQVTITNTKTTESRHLRLFHIRKWPNDPDTEDEDLYNLLSLIKQAKLWNEKANGKRILVHCSSGTGRTGVLIALNNIMEQAEFDKVMNILQVVRRERQQRMGMVQTVNQYELVHKGALVFYRHFYQPWASDDLSTTKSESVTVDIEDDSVVISGDDMALIISTPKLEKRESVDESKISDTSSQPSKTLALGEYQEMSSISQPKENGEIA